MGEQIHLYMSNSFAMGRSGFDIKHATFNIVLLIGFFGPPHDKAII